MSAQNTFITLSINRKKLEQSLVVLPTLIIASVFITIAISDLISANTRAETPADSQNQSIALPVNAVDVVSEEHAGYPLSGSDLNPNLFASKLPPPPLDALPYDVRSPLSNGISVVAKKRWLWIPPGQAIVVSDNDGALKVDVPLGSMWWKEFYLETDRGAFLIERRIILRVASSRTHPEGWAFYSSHYMPDGLSSDSPLFLASTSEEAQKLAFQPTDWMPTQSQNRPLEIRLQDERGLDYPYVFPGQTECMVCHGGASGAYPNGTEDPILIFGLHPNNLTPESFMALVERGWIRNGESLLTEGYLEAATEKKGERSLDELTSEVVGVLRNNCASCHNSSPLAASSFSGFILDPNYPYNTSELVTLLSVNGKMLPDSHPLVTPGDLEQSELWLRLVGLQNRRRMPPVEGGLPESDPRITELIAEWIVRVNQSE